MREVGVLLTPRPDSAILSHFSAIRHDERIHPQPVWQPRASIKLYQRLENLRIYSLSRLIRAHVLRHQLLAHAHYVSPELLLAERIGGTYAFLPFAPCIASDMNEIWRAN